MQIRKTKTDLNGRERTGMDVSDGGAMFSLESSGSEEFKLQVKAMQSLVGNFLDQDGEEYAQRFKEKFGITLDPDEAQIHSHYLG